MIFGVGTDIIEISRIEKVYNARGRRILERLFTQRELDSMSLDIATIAGRFAAKEAVAKSLGVGFGLISWKDIEIIKDKLGKPRVYLKGNAQKRARSLGISRLHLSISHSKTDAIAYVIAEG
ncbi:holo-ACP synthase [Proteinivorax hydrogeniformans]|uniref:Holo-[acyl-carrier-protein] synthase n=1 Tax=Proteinivorax hydrogeniformans TaxID=1826727 RepID=A0AAU8HSR6_9FIRM